MVRRIRPSPTGGAPEPRIGMRVWLGAAFATVGVLTAASVYFFVSDSAERNIADRTADLAIGRAVNLAEQLGEGGRQPEEVIAEETDSGFQAWLFDSEGELVAPQPAGPVLERLPRREEAIATALDGRRHSEDLRQGRVTFVAVPVLGETIISGALLARSSRPGVLEGAIQRLRRDSLRALGVAVAIGVLAGFLVATLIASRVKMLARSAEQMAAGRLDVPLQVAGRDEIGDLARALDSMRSALDDSFKVLSSERDKLAAIFDGLSEPVMVVENEGGVRFANRAAGRLLEDGEPPQQLLPHLRRAAEHGFAAHPALRIGDRAYALQARNLPAEQAVLVVVRDRTEELRREVAEADFISNAAHELRNPLAGISGAIEVLRGGAKDDPDAREHFLDRLADDAERMSRMTQSLLTLARVDALGPAEAEVVDVGLAARDAVEAVEAPPGIEVSTEVEPELMARADPTLLRQVLIGFLTNAYKNTPAPGAVSLRARRGGDGEVMVEVEDTGTGIPAGEVERVFERFYRRSESRRQEGFGLGLAIAKKMVDVMAGEIGVDSREGEGSTFWVRLPLAETTRTPVA